MYKVRLQQPISFAEIDKLQLVTGGKVKEEKGVLWLYF
jgi:hypothetical protein